MDVVGKTIARIESEGYGETIYFTDGTAIQVTSDDGHYWKEFARGERQKELQGQREAARLRRLQREERASLSQEERDERDRVRRSKMDPVALAVEDEMRAFTKSVLLDFHRTAYGTIPAPPKRRNARRS